MVFALLPDFLCCSRSTGSAQITSGQLDQGEHEMPADNNGTINQNIKQRMTLRLPVSVSELIHKHSENQRRSFTSQLLYMLERNLANPDIQQQVLSLSGHDTSEAHTAHYMRFPNDIHQKLRIITSELDLTLKQVITAIVRIDDQAQASQLDDQLIQALSTRLPSTVLQSLTAEAESESITVLDKISTLLIEAYRS